MVKENLIRPCIVCSIQTDLLCSECHKPFCPRHGPIRCPICLGEKKEPHGIDCWPPSSCIDPDHCPVIYAIFMQVKEENFEVVEYFRNYDE